MKKKISIFTIIILLISMFPIQGISSAASVTGVTNQNKTVTKFDGIDIYYDTRGVLTIGNNSENIYLDNEYRIGIGDNLQLTNDTVKPSSKYIVTKAIIYNEETYYEIDTDRYIKGSKNVTYKKIPKDIKKILVQNKLLENTRGIISKANKMKTEVEKVLLIHQFVTTQTEYLLLSGTDYVDTNEFEYQYTKEGALVFGSAVCDGYTYAMNYLLNEIGIESKRLLSKEMNHSWNLVKVDGDWYHIDATWDDNGVLPSLTYCLISDNRMIEKEHYGWSSSDKATSEKFYNIMQRYKSLNSVYINSSDVYFSSTDFGYTDIGAYYSYTEIWKGNIFNGEIPEVLTDEQYISRFEIYGDYIYFFGYGISRISMRDTGHVEKLITEKDIRMDINGVNIFKNKIYFDAKNWEEDGFAPTGLYSMNLDGTDLKQIKSYDASNIYFRSPVKMDPKNPNILYEFVNDVRNEIYITH